MEITGKVHLLFEQSATFRDVFRELGYEAYCYDIQNNFGKTDYQIDLFKEIGELNMTQWMKAMKLLEKYKDIDNGTDGTN